MTCNSWPDVSLIGNITPHQRSMLRAAWAKPFGVLGGNPGVGKTHTTAQAIKKLIEIWDASEVKVCAPTGKAAVRITELLLKAGVEGIEASTIHRALGVSRNGHDGAGWGFMHNSRNPFKCKFVIVDESSMLDTSLGADFLSACAPGTHGLFIGDFAQLPPVGHGAPLRDMIAAGIPYGELTEPHRNEGDVVKACRALKEGRPMVPSANRLSGLDLEAGRNLLHWEVAGGENQRAALAKMLSSVPYGYDPVWDVQVLVAVNEDTPVCRDELNKLLQGVLNPNGWKLTDNARFRIGDKVICGTNMLTRKLGCFNQWCRADWDSQSWDARDKKYHCAKCSTIYGPKDLGDDFVANGEIGKVVGIFPGVMHVYFDSPRRCLRIAGESLEEFDLAYAITTHKSQGSQWPICIVVADDTPSADFVTSWEWWRTAISRVEKLCVTLGRKAAIDRQCKKSALRDRKTFLQEKIRRLVA